MAQHEPTASGRAADSQLPATPRAVAPASRPQRAARISAAASRSATTQLIWKLAASSFSAASSKQRVVPAVSAQRRKVRVAEDIPRPKLLGLSRADRMVGSSQRSAVVRKRSFWGSTDSSARFNHTISPAWPDPFATRYVEHVSW